MRAGAEAVDHRVSHEALWLCPSARLVEIFDRAGFDCRFEPEGLQDGRGLILGARR